MEFASKIFLDGGDPDETRQADELLKTHGHPGIQGQTTNPSLIGKRFAQIVHRSSNDKVSTSGAIDFYRKTVIDMAKITSGPISIQVIGEPQSLNSDVMLAQARERITWIPNGVIKFPCTSEGLKAAEVFCQEGPVNITLVFSQEQAAAVYAATRHATYDVYVSPFVGRLDDRGENGMDVVANISEMYKKFGDNHVKLLTASVRSVKHLLYALWLKSDAITVPFKILNEWSNARFPTPESDFFYDAPGLTEIPYRELSLENEWSTYDISHDLTTKGLFAFWEDWKAAVGSSPS